jgi:hypothetical protein
VVWVSVCEQPLADRDGTVRCPEPVGECIEDRAVLAGDVGVDENDAVAIAYGVARDNRGAQAPQPIIQFFELDGHRGHSSSVPITRHQCNWSVGRSCSTACAHEVVSAGFHRRGRTRGDIELPQNVFDVSANRRP